MSHYACDVWYFFNQRNQPPLDFAGRVDLISQARSSLQQYSLESVVFNDNPSHLFVPQKLLVPGRQTTQ